MNITTFSAPKTENAVTIVVMEAIDDDLYPDPEKLYEQIFPLIKEGKNVIVDFQNFEESTPAFMSVAIGELYEHFPAEQIEKSLSFINTDEEVAFDIETVVKWTKEYLKDPVRYNNAAREALGGAYE
jgi:hypothetical protein